MGGAVSAECSKTQAKLLPGSRIALGGPIFVIALLRAGIAGV
jgi:hypothetical protein